MLVEPFLPFFLLVLGLYATPGPATLSIAASGAIHGFQKTIYYIVGIIIGLMIIFILISLGFVEFLFKYQLVHFLILGLSIVYIFYLAYKIAISSPTCISGSSRFGLSEGIILVLLNPKAYIAVSLTVVQFVNASENRNNGYLIVMVWVFILSLLINFTWAAIGRIIGLKLSKKGLPKLVNYIFAMILILSVILAIFWQGSAFETYKSRFNSPLFKFIIVNLGS